MRWLLPFLFWLPAMVWADDAEREGIEAERQRLIEQFSKEERECQQRFAVTDCVENVRRRSREALDALRARELDLDDAERQRRAAQRRAAIEAKQKAQAERAPAAPPLADLPAANLPPVVPPPAALPSAALPPDASPAEAPARKMAPPAAAAAPGSAASPPRSRADDSQARAAKAAERARASQRRREEAQAALERVQKRAAEREASGKAAAPLPLPDAASAPRR